MAARLAVEIIGDASSLERALKKSARSAKSFESGVERTGRRGRSAFAGVTRGVGLLTAGLGVAGLAGAAHAAFSEMAEGQRVAAQTDAALKSTGQIANVTAKHVDDLANAMLNKTGIDDEATKSAENLLLTFTNVRNEAGKGNKIFDRTTTAIADVATAMNRGATPSAEQLQKATIQLGKALNDPIKGVTALSRIGIQFTKDQKAQIKTLVESGHTLEAQKLILAEVGKEMGGRAAASGRTLSGQLNKLREIALNLGGQLATTLLPSITKIVNAASKWLSNTKNQKTVLNAFKGVVSAVTTTVRILKGAFDALSTVVGGNRNAVIALVAAFATFKVLTIAATLTKLATTLGLVTAGAEGASMAFMGPVGLAVAAGVAGFAITSLFLKLTGLDDKLKSVGSAAFDLADKLGLAGDDSHKGKRGVSAADLRSLKRQSDRLVRGGLSPAQAADALAQRHPNIAKPDIEIAQKLRPMAVTINGGVHLHGVQNPKDMERQLQKRAHARAHVRRGAQ